MTRTRLSPPLPGRSSLAAVAALVSGVALLGVSPVRAGVTAAEAPSDLLAIPSAGAVRLGWASAGPDDTGYRITASTGRTWRVRADSAESGAQAVRLTGLRNGVAVRFRVSAISHRGVGPPSSPSSSVTPRHPAGRGQWTTARPLHLSRSGASPLRLRNGTVLVFGGFEAGGTSERKTLEAYNPRTGAWSAPRPMDRSRSEFTATLLQDGRVLVTGGYTSLSAVHRSAAIYNAATGRWFAAAPMHKVRARHTATLLTDGRVLVVGGATGTGLPRYTAEFYDPRTNRWSQTASLHVARYGHSATRLRDGRLLVVGGTDGFEGLRSAEIYDPATGMWTTTSRMSVTREFDTVCCKGTVLLNSGKVLVAGGSDGAANRRVSRSAEIYDPATGTWSATGAMRVGRAWGGRFVRLADGKVLAVGGGDDYGALRHAETYDERTARWTRVNDLELLRTSPAVVTLADGRVLVAGGSTNFLGDSARRSAELFRPA